jgi:N-acetylglutamate synthase-like GNAT family acetyltransferase
MNIQIIKLSELPTEDRNQVISALAVWNYNSWHKYDNKVTIDGSRKNFELRALNKDTLPLTLVALNKDIENIEESLVGTVTLKQSIPVPGYEDKTPWLGSLMVKEEYQNQGIGTQLITAANKLSVELGFKEIFLFTSNSFMPAWYAKPNRGWEILNQDTYPKNDPKEHTITIMRKNLSKIA